MEIKNLGLEEWRAAIQNRSYAAQRTYAAMFSTWFGGVVTDPTLMMIPIDDHGFHRGDAIFEAMKCTGQKIYALDRHLDRLFRSAERISLKSPMSHDELRTMIVATVKASGLSEAIIRLYVSRGPGTFSPNPYDSIGAQVYCVVTSYKPLPQEKYDQGIKAAVSRIGVKEGIFATVKSCNYLPNVLMKKEAVDRGVDFTVSIDEKGCFAEGSTENFAIISRDGEFLVPGFARTLRGITVTRMMELAQKMIANGQMPQGLVTGVKHADLHLDDIKQAREMLFFGTTLDCIAVTELDGHPVSGRKVGPVAKFFDQCLKRDLLSGDLLTVVK